MSGLWGFGPSTYGTGGYPVYLPAQGLANATAIVDSLFNDRWVLPPRVCGGAAICDVRVARAMGMCRWVDEGTRAVAVTFSAYNTNSRLLTVSRFLVEFFSTGAVQPSWTVRSLRLILYVLCRRMCLVFSVTSCMVCPRVRVRACTSSQIRKPVGSSPPDWGASHGAHVCFHGRQYAAARAAVCVLLTRGVPCFGCAQLQKEARRFWSTHPRAQYFFLFRSWFEMLFFVVNGLTGVYWLMFILSAERDDFDVNVAVYHDYFDVRANGCHDLSARWLCVWGVHLLTLCANVLCYVCVCVCVCVFMCVCMCLTGRSSVPRSP